MKVNADQATQYVNALKASNAAGNAAEINRVTTEIATGKLVEVPADWRQTVATAAEVRERANPVTSFESRTVTTSTSARLPAAWPRGYGQLEEQPGGTAGRFTGPLELKHPTDPVQGQLGNSYEIAAMAAVGLSQSTRVTTTHSVDQNNRDNILGALRGGGSAVVSGSGQHPLKVRLEEKGGVAEIVLKNPWQSQSEERLSVDDFIKRFAAGSLATTQSESTVKNVRAPLLRYSSIEAPPNAASRLDLKESHSVTLTEQTVDRRNRSNILSALENCASAVLTSADARPMSLWLERKNGEPVVVLHNPWGGDESPRKMSVDELIRSYPSGVLTTVAQPPKK